MRTTILKYASLGLLAGLASSFRVAAAETPRRSEEFIDSIGLVTHLDDVSSSVYNEATIGQLGVRHLRSNMRPGVMALLENRLRSLYFNYGIRVNIVCDTTDVSPTAYRDMMRDPVYESIEGLNEPDAAGPRSYRGMTDNLLLNLYPATLAFQQDLFNAMTADPLTASKAVFSPAMANPAKSVYLKNAAADFVSVHSYPAQLMPTGNFLASFAIPSALAMTSDTTMKVIATETGYMSGSKSTDVSHAAAAKYIPRTFAEYFRLGVVRTFLFELTDVPGVYNFGILSSSFTPKAAYAPLKNLISLLNESSWDASQRTWNVPPETNAAAIDYTMTGDTSKVHRILLRKSDGRIYLLLWQEVPSYDLAGHRDVANPTVAVNLTFNIAVDSAALYNLNSTAPVATYSNFASLRIDVPDEVVVLEITPGAVVSRVGPGLPEVSLTTVFPKAKAGTDQQGKISASRTGSTDEPLTVGYSIAGNAVAGPDYDGLSGGITIPAGASEATITITSRNAAMAGRKDVVLTLNPDSAYTLGASKTATVYIGDARTSIATFDNDAIGWFGNAGASVTRDTSNPDSGAAALKTSLTVNGRDRWIANFQYTFPRAQDWSAVSSLEVRVKEGLLNPAGDSGKAVYFTWSNRGSSVGGGYGVAKFPMILNHDYRTISLDLRDFPRDAVTSLHFYIDGAEVPVGSHVLYFDSMTAVTNTGDAQEAFTLPAGSTWTSGGRSHVAIGQTSADSSLQALTWTYDGVSGQRWDNHIQVSLPSPQDLRGYSTLSFRFKESSSNAAEDAGQVIYLDWYNNGARPNGDSGAAAFAVRPASGGYRTVDISLGSLPRDRVTSLFFYVDGGSLKSGKHSWTIDGITAK